MDKAHDPVRGDLITVATYIVRYGSKMLNGHPNPRPTMVCPACDEPVHTVAEGLPGRDAVWAHDPNPSGPWCPIKDIGGAKYSLLSPTKPDALAGVALREAFLANWHKHWGLISSIIDLPDIHHFVDFIKSCDSNRFWSHVGLQEWHLPYIFMATAEFPPPKGAKALKRRTEWVRFRFDSKVRTFDNLWIYTTGTWRFLMMRFRKPRNGVPNGTHFLGCDWVVPDPNFLSKTYLQPNTYQLGAMKKEFGV